MRTARVIYHHEAGGWWAESPDVPGWSAAGGNFREVRGLADEGVEFFAEEEMQLVHEFPMSGPQRPVTAGVPAKLLMVVGAGAPSGLHFEEQAARTAGAQNEALPT